MLTDYFLKVEIQNLSSRLKQHLIEKSPEPIFCLYDEINLIELLMNTCCEKIFYFKSKYKNFSFLGLGHSQTIAAVDLENYLKKHPEYFLIAAFQFEENPSNASFILPEWIFISKEGKTELAIHPSIDYKKYSSPNLFFNLLASEFNSNVSYSSWESYNEFPEHDQWNLMIKKCDSLFDNNELEKIVLSRKKIFEYREPINPVSFLKAVLEKNNSTNSNYIIFHQTSFDQAFISLTPEKFFSLEGKNFESISLAASAPRGLTPDEDKNFEVHLCSNEKLIREHSLVTEEIVRKLKPLSEFVNRSDLQTMKLPYIQHRSILIKAKLLKNVFLNELVKQLHPTPAVGGLPWDNAQKTILELETCKRKSYASPLGVISAEYSELAVGIRSALIEGAKLTIYGGAGIVKGSNAEEEWIETGIKMKQFLKVVNE